MKRIEIDKPFAVFSDVHGNLPALEAVLEDVERRRIEDVICLGDLVGYGPFPNEAAALVRNRRIPTVMGNYDRGIGFSLGECGCVYRTDEQRAEGAVSLRWTDAVTNDDTRAYLRSLEDRYVLATPAGELLAVHGSPRRINEYLFEDRPASAMRRMAEENSYRAILFGHTHIPYVRQVGGTAFINVGSAGRPKDGDWRASYAVIDAAPVLVSESEVAVCAGTLGVELVRVPYNHARLVAALAATELITSFDGPPGTD